MIAGCGAVPRIFFRRLGPMGEKLTGDIAGIAPLFLLRRANSGFIGKIFW
jgi:hypothetical protein